MSWLVSRALMVAYENSRCSPEPEGESSAATCSAGAAFALSSGTPTPRAFLPPDKMTDFSRPSRFGMTFGPLMDDLGEGLLTWFRGGFLAKTSASPGTETDWMASDPASGPKWRGSLASYDPDLRSWKTAQHSLLGDSEEFSETWPRWGTTLAGELFLLPTLVRPTDENESGSWPTPTKSDGTGGPGNSGRAGGLNLRTAVTVWPTPTVCGNHNRKGASATSGDGLATAVKTWPTPVASMPKGSSPATLTRKSGRSRENDRLDHKVMATDGGQLNPTWVELLMGWPAGWTDLQPMNNGEFYDWCKGFGSEGLRDLRGDLRAGKVQWAAGGRDSLHEAQALQPFVREQQVAGQDWNTALASAQTPEGCLRGVRLHEAAGRASLRSGPVQQRPVELADVVQPLPRLLARHGQAAWASGRWEDAVPRVAHGVAARVDRLTATGNGQVPQAAALAWRTLTGNLK